MNQKDERALQNERHEIERLSRDRDDGIEILERNIKLRIQELAKGKKINKYNSEDLKNLKLNDLLKINFNEEQANKDSQVIKNQYLKVKQEN